MQIPLLAWLLQGIPETIAMVTLITVLSTQQLQWKSIFKVALIQAVTAYLIRLLPFTMGVHTIVLLTTLALYLALIVKIKFPIAAIATAITAAILIILEATFHFALIKAGFGSFSDLIYHDVWVRILVGYPQILVLFALAWLIYRRKYNLANLFNKASKDW